MSGKFKLDLCLYLDFGGGQGVYESVGFRLKVLFLQWDVHVINTTSLFNTFSVTKYEYNIDANAKTYAVQSSQMFKCISSPTDY